MPPKTPTPSSESQEASKPRELVVQEQLLLTLESAYPNILPTDDLAQYVLHFHYYI